MKVKLKKVLVLSEGYWLMKVKTRGKLHSNIRENDSSSTLN